MWQAPQYIMCFRVHVYRILSRQAMDVSWHGSNTYKQRFLIELDFMSESGRIYPWNNIVICTLLESNNPPSNSDNKVQRILLYILWRPTLGLEFGYRLSGFVWDKGICQCPPAQVGGSLHRGRTTITEPSIYLSYRHRNHGAPSEVAHDNILWGFC